MSKKVEKMRYQKNSISYFLALLAIVTNSLYMDYILGSMTIVPELNIGIDIVINIIFLLFVFLGAEKVKVYTKHWGYILIGIGIFSFFRILYIPLRLLNIKDYTGIDFTNFMYLCYMLIATGSLLIVSGIITIRKSTALHHYLSKLEKH